MAWGGCRYCNKPWKKCWKANTVCCSMCSHEKVKKVKK